MPRQQRTTYLRQTLQPDSPALLSDMLWVVSGVTNEFVQLQVYGSFDDVVTGAVPQMVLEPGNVTPVGFSFAGPPAPGLYGLLTLEFATPVPDVFVLTLQQRSRCIRNRFGGLVAPGMGVWPSQAITPSSINALHYNTDGFKLLLQAVGGTAPVCGNLNCVAVQSGTGDLCPLTAVQDEILTFTAPNAAWVSGDHLTLAVASENCIDQLGGQLQPFDVVVP